MNFNGSIFLGCGKNGWTTFPPAALPTNGTSPPLAPKVLLVGDASPAPTLAKIFFVGVPCGVLFPPVLLLGVECGVGVALCLFERAVGGGPMSRDTVQGISKSA